MKEIVFIKSDAHETRFEGVHGFLTKQTSLI